MDKLSWISESLRDLKKQGLLINLRVIDSPMGPKIKVDEKWVLNFCSNNYLGLANDPTLKNEAKKAIDEYGIGPTAVRTIAGTTILHLELEKRLAEFKKAEAVISLQSGFAANLATVPALVGEGDVIFSDELNHASIIDACRLSKAEVVRYNHCDPKDLEEKIATNKVRPYRRLLIISDGVFSMNGDIAPLPELVNIAEKYDALLMVDDAHGEGVLGASGRGIVDHFNLHGKVDVEVGTMSKAFGVVGGYVAGRKLIIDWLRQRARPFLFSSAMTVPDTAACLAAVKILEKSDNLVKKLWKNTKYFKSRMNELGFNLGMSQTPITPVILGEAKLAQEFSKKLFDNGVFATAIVYPTVPLGTARIRVMMSAAHSKDNLEFALEVFEKVGRKLKVIKRSEFTNTSE
ncbi:8-amino-7-oxononanoate synthase [Candidatus Woesebacteria bacterium RIFCSPHIGHO2_01_FULL_38_9]|uniref:8-amino-7-ketopelargonate synthase n=2 Tax=Candidatus Woeseibacteriota TaxID=1752722 RepID=A0A1F7Y2T2_9BACT|nr:MAG: 8-amino-7-oxononanoate synthase [Candidatus Woesebacteria bacterium RIFCSPHIGHO2_01_FULL_38_9]OGM58779.1 MAG: 8-amino-7-oxononanoate synthase [Candidatus Woesebacteria bacterium RIFCSPLOWO2_01_FULL_39_10]